MSEAPTQTDPAAVAPTTVAAPGPDPMAIVGSGTPVILFDGACILCDRSVRFVTRRDPAGRFRLASLQSDPGRALLAAHGMPADTIDTMVLVDPDGAHVRSDAAWRIARGLRGIWPLLGTLLRIILRPLRDVGYNIVARNRYRWFGRKDVCEVSDGGVRERML